MITGEWLRGGPSLTLLLDAALERPAAHIARRNIKSKDQLSLSAMEMETGRSWKPPATGVPSQPKASMTT
ncbi:hypothetical protein [Shinella granuli]|uniref:hypothetical protein n=1 Tax=Shinella granuli TaxID=323621 RepID=UPI0010553211|nr:hypothetical protein [Shinella granuli]